MKLLVLTASAAGMMLAACSQPASKTDAPAAVAAPVASADVQPFRIGDLQAWSLRDGEITLPLQGEGTPWKDVSAITSALTAAGQPTDAIHLSIQPLLVRDGERLVLIDAGAGGTMGTENKLMASLASAGIDPATITDVLISHAHGDHVGGLVGADGQLNFPNAVIRMSAPEWAYAQAGAEAAGAGALLAAITPKVEPFEPGARISPSIVAVPLLGHTPGHTGYRIGTGSDAVLYFGDAMHSSAISVGAPGVANAWDDDGAAGVATRERLLSEGAAGSLRYYGVHFPWPGLGRIQQRGEGYVWVPDAAAQP